MSIKGQYQGQYKNANQYVSHPQMSHRSSTYNSNSNSRLDPSSKHISTSTSIKDINSLTNLNYPNVSSSKNLYTQQIYQQPFARNAQFFETEREDRISTNNSAKVTRNSSLTHQLEKTNSYLQQKSSQGKYGVLGLKQNNQLQRKVIDIASKMEKIQLFIKKHDRQIIQLWKDSKDLKQLREYVSQESSGINVKSMGNSKISKIGNDRDKQNLIDGQNILLQKISSKISEHNPNSQNFSAQNLRKQFQSIKNQLQKRVTREKLHDQFFHMETSIRTAISNMRETITKQMNQFTQNTLKQRKKDLQKLKGIVNGQVKISEEKVKKLIQSLQNKLFEIQKSVNAGQIKVSTKKYQGKPLHLKLIQNYSVQDESYLEQKKPQTPYPKAQNSNNQLKVQVSVRKSAQYCQEAQDKQNRDKAKPNIYYKTLSLYKIDRQGYLLDDYSYYLLDSKGNQIRLQTQHLKLLQKTGLYY